MQDKYVGDIGDFGKYALLKFLAKRDIPLGIVWYLTNTPGSDGDGGFIEYLSSPDEARGLGMCDAQLFSVLRVIVDSHDRRVARVRELGIFPEMTAFFEDQLDFNGVPARERCDQRKQWFQNALTQVQRAALVFLDPDNGLSLNDKIRHRKNGPKYVFLDEMWRFLNRGQSLIIYCHQDRRKGGLPEQVRQGIQLVRKEGPIQKAWAFTFHRKSVRIYFVVPGCESMGELLAQRSRGFIDGCFGAGGHFQLWGLR